MDNNNLFGDRIFNERATSCHDMAQFGTLGSGHYLCGGGGGIMGWARLIFLEKRGGRKENFTMIGGGSLCVFCKESHSLQFMWKI